jgi:hypothetical protein
MHRTIKKDIILFDRKRKTYVKSILERDVYGVWNIFTILGEPGFRTFEQAALRASLNGFSVWKMHPYGKKYVNVNEAGRKNGYSTFPNYIIWELKNGLTSS